LGHEYILVYARSLSYIKEVETIWREEKPGAREIWEHYLTLRQKHGVNNSSIEKDLQSWFSELPNKHPSKKWSRYKRIDQFGPWRDRDISWPGGDGPRYDVLHPSSKLPCLVPEAGWRFSKPEEMQRQIELGLIVFRDDHSQPPFRKAHLKPVPLESFGAEDSESDDDDENDELATQVRGSCIYKQSQVSVKYLRNLMGAKLFDNPKDHVELKGLIKYVTSDDGIILDFFAGSGSTAEAVLDLNHEAGISSKFILVQLPEPITGKDKTGKAAMKTGFKTIADIAKERIRRAGNKIRGELADQLDLDGNKNLDLGFKVLKLAQSNFKQWQAPNKDITDTELLKQIELNVDHVDPNASPEDLLYELLIKAGVMPTEKIESIEIAEHPVFSVADESLLIHLGDSVDQKLIDAVLAKAPQQFICLDKAFDGNDQLKANAVKTFATFNHGKEKIDQIDFKTV
jgi:adenine-specific DNA-methyltransferase